MTEKNKSENTEGFQKYNGGTGSIMWKILR